MADSIETIGSPRVNRLHGGPLGHLHKGHSTVAHSATIPTKFHTVVIDNGDKKGFSSGSRRFQYESMENGNPSSMNYNVRRNLVNTGPSLSKKGTGGFASKQRRSMTLDSGCGAEPNIYTLPSALVSRRDFNSSTTANFHKDIAVKREKLSDSPAANRYDLSNCAPARGKENKVTAASSFNSRTKREFMDLREVNQKPGPGRYNVGRADAILYADDMAAVSSFKSTSKRRFFQPPPSFPGPAAYNLNDTVEDCTKRMLFPRKHYLCLSAPALPLPPTPAGPGPGQYELNVYERPRHFMSGSVFLSNTSRWVGGGDDSIAQNKSVFPGPSHYHPTQLGRQSFLYNAAGKWM